MVPAGGEPRKLQEGKGPGVNLVLPGYVDGRQPRSAAGVGITEQPREKQGKLQVALGLGYPVKPRAKADIASECTPPLCVRGSVEHQAKLCKTRARDPRVLRHMVVGVVHVGFMFVSQGPMKRWKRRQPSYLL